MKFIQSHDVKHSPNHKKYSHLGTPTVLECELKIMWTSFIYLKQQRLHMCMHSIMGVLLQKTREIGLKGTWKEKNRDKYSK